MKKIVLVVVVLMLVCVGCFEEGETVDPLAVGSELTWAGKVISVINGKATVSCGNYMAEFNISEPGVYARNQPQSRTYTGTIVSVEDGILGLAPVIKLKNVSQH